MRSNGFRYTFLGVAAIFAALAMLSCEQKNGTANQPKGLTLSANDKTVAYNGSTSLTIVASVDWTLSVTEGKDWITPSITSGAAKTTKTVNFTLVPNSGEKPRTGSVAINASGESTPYTFTIVQNSPNTLTGVNKWIYDELSGWYYWNEVVKATEAPSNSLPYDEFLEKAITNLPWSKVQDTSDGENPPTIDGQYVFDSNGNPVTPLERDHIYSFIERTAATRAAEGTETTFGFGVVPFQIGTNRVGYLVKWVLPEGPADKAGLKRGTWIYKYNSAEMTMNNYMAFQYQLLYFEGGNTMSFTDDAGKDYSVTAVSMKVSPILAQKTIPTDGGKTVAYLMYNGFETGEDDEFHADLRKVFGEFKAAGATELVLDLRYNPGGYVHTCQLLTSLMADVTASDIFCKQLYNDDIAETWTAAGYSGKHPNPEIGYFLNEPNSLELKKVYVLATEASASASEMVISSIRGIHGDGAVVHLGAKTNGKNVGSLQRETTIDGYRYEMWPITFKIQNAKNFCDYAGGFAPNYQLEEYWELMAANPNATHVLYDFGDPKETLLAGALALIDGKNVPAQSAKTRTAPTAERELRRLPMPEIPGRGGAKYIPGKFDQSPR